MTRERGFYIDAVVKGYFGAMDSGDVEGTVACFAPDATGSNRFEGTGVIPIPEDGGDIWEDGPNRGRFG